MAEAKDTMGTPQNVEYVSRPTLGDLLRKDIFVYAIASAIVVIWVIYFVVFSLGSADTTTESGLSATELFVIFLLMTLGDLGILGWRLRSLATFANRGVETTAKVTGITGVGDQVGVDYEYTYDGAKLKGSIGLGGFATTKKAERFIGRQIVVLVNPDKPKRTLVISKLK